VPDIFLSYSRVDQARAKPFAEALAAEGYDVWWDVALKAGEAYDEVTEHALNTAPVVVVLWSPRSAESRWVRAEATVAQRNGALLPVVIEDCRRPVMFELVQTADLVGWSGDRAAPAWRRFLEDLRLKLGGQGGRAATPRSEPAAPSAAPRSSERRQVAILSCAPCAGAEVHEDPEDWQAQSQAFVAQARKLLAEVEGASLTEHGASLTVVFGAERSREDDARRAVDAALALKEALGPDASVHFGVDAGLVVAAADGGASGPAADGAVRLRLQASPGQILVSPAVAKLAEGYFSLGAGPGRTSEVTGRTRVASRFDLSRARGLSRFVGREAVLAQLETALAESAAGAGQVVGLMADAGSGKSRLCFEFAQQCRARGVRVFAGAAVQGRNAPFAAVTAALRAVFEVEPQDEPSVARDKIRQGVLALDPELADSLPLILELLERPDPDEPPSGLNPEDRRPRLVGLTRHLLRRAGEARPTVMMVEDLHWLDEASAGVLEQLVDAREDLRNLLVLNYRPEFRAGWMQTSHVRQLSLPPLGEAAVGLLLEDLLGPDASVTPLHAPILQLTKGNPYFIEEVVQTLAETGKLEGSKGGYLLPAPLASLETPPTVRAVVAARIDRLAERERGLLQMAAVVGHRFSEPLLLEVAGLTPADLGTALSALRRGEFIVEEAAFPVREFAFRHPLTHEGALGSLTKISRRGLHARLAGVLEAGAQAEAHPGLLAYHWDEAGQALPAAGWHLKAGDQTVRSDLRTAARHWRRVCELTRSEATPEAAGLFVGAAIQLLNIAHRVGITLEEATALRSEAETVAGGDPGAVLMLSICYSPMLRAYRDIAGYLNLSAANHEAAVASGDLMVTIIAKIRYLDALSHSGRHPEALAEAESGMALYARDLPRPPWLPDFHPHDFFAFLRGVSLIWLGRLAEGEQQILEAIARAKAEGTPEIVAYASYGGAHGYHCLGDAAKALAAAAEVRAVGDKLGSPLVMSYSHMAYTWAHLTAGDPEAALREIRAAAELFRSWEQHWADAARMLEARCHLDLGRPAEAAKWAQSALEGFEICSIKHFEIEAWGVLARARLRSEGGGARPAAREALEQAERLIDTYRLEVMRPFLFEWRAEVEGDAGGPDGAWLDRAAEAHRRQDAPLQVARLAAVRAAAVA